MDHPLPDLPASDHDPAPDEADTPSSSVTEVLPTWIVPAATPPPAGPPPSSGPTSGPPDAAATTPATLTDATTAEPVDDPVEDPRDAGGLVDPGGDSSAPDDGDEPAATRRPGWRSPWAMAAAILLVVVIVTAVALVSTLRSTNRARGDLADATAAGTETQADLDQADRDLQAQRTQLATVLGHASAVGDQLAADTAKRDDQSSAVDQARSDLNTLNGLLNSQRANLFAQATLMTQLSDCINEANVALNLMSFGDRDKGTTLLQDASQKCDAVNDYLAGRGVTK